MSLSIGSLAPDFKVNDQDGKPVKLSDYKGKKVVLYFYPKDMTPGCTAESCNLRDNYTRFQKAGYEIFGISTDDEKSHQKFIAKEKLPFKLLADPEKKVHSKYHTWVEKSMYGRKYMGTARITFVINEEGVIEDIIDKVDTKNHTDQILKMKSASSTPEKKAPKKAPAPKVRKPTGEPAKKSTKKLAGKPIKKVAPKKSSRQQSATKTVAKKRK